MNPSDPKFFEGWYQTITLPSGRVIRGEQNCKPRWKAMRLLHGDLTGKKIMDLGAAEGYFALKCACAGADVVGVEGDEDTFNRLAWVMAESKRICGEDIGALFPVHQDVEYGVDLQVDDVDFIDGVLSLNLIHHLEGPFAHIANVARVLKPRGVLYLEAPFEPGRGVRIRKSRNYVVGNELLTLSLRRLFTQVAIVHDWKNSVGNRRLMWECVK